MQDALDRLRAAIVGRNPEGFTEVAALDMLALAPLVRLDADEAAQILIKAARRSLKRDRMSREILPGQESVKTNPLTGALAKLIKAAEDGAA